MNREFKQQATDNDEMLPEYDFSGGVRGKHYQAYRRGYQVIVHKMDGTTEVRDFALPEGVVILDPDVRVYFPDSEAVNRTLRGLIGLMPQQHTPGAQLVGRQEAHAHKKGARECWKQKSQSNALLPPCGSTLQNARPGKGGGVVG